MTFVTYRRLVVGFTAKLAAAPPRQFHSHANGRALKIQLQRKLNYARVRGQSLYLSEGCA